MLTVLRVDNRRLTDDVLMCDINWDEPIGKKEKKTCLGQDLLSGLCLASDSALLQKNEHVFFF